MGHTSIKDFKKIIKMNAIKLCPVKMEDIDICENIFGPNMYTFKVKVVRTKSKEVVDYYIEIPQDLKDTHQNTELCDDIMYIQE